MTLAFFDYLRNITYYLVFIAVVGIAAPSGKYKKYINLMMGIVLICIMTQPIQSLINGNGIPITQLFAQIIPIQTGNIPETADYEQWRYEAVKAAFNEQLEIQLTTVLAQLDYILTETEIETSDDFSQITILRLTVSEKEKAPTRKPFIRIEPVTIPGNTEPSDNDEAYEIKKFIAGFYNIPIDNIYVYIQKTEAQTNP